MLCWGASHTSYTALQLPGQIRREASEVHYIRLSFLVSKHISLLSLSLFLFVFLLPGQIRREAAVSRGALP